MYHIAHLQRIFNTIIRQVIVQNGNANKQCHKQLTVSMLAVQNRVEK